MKFANPYATNLEKINALQNWILVQSYIYYELDNNLVSDFEYDKNCKQLLQLIQEDEKSFKKSNFYAVFKDFDGTTGFNLFYKLSGKLQQTIARRAKKAIIICKLVEKEKQKNEKKK